jgi:hypothetical protein
MFAIGGLHLPWTRPHRFSNQVHAIFFSGRLRLFHARICFRQHYVGQPRTHGSGGASGRIDTNGRSGGIPYWIKGRRKSGRHLRSDFRILVFPLCGVFLRFRGTSTERGIGSRDIELEKNRHAVDVQRLADYVELLKLKRDFETQEKVDLSRFESSLERNQKTINQMNLNERNQLRNKRPYLFLCLFERSLS